MIDLQYALLAALAILAGYIGYQRAFHPLARYPGPFWASLTNLWSLSLSTKGDWPRQLRALHARYGPVVRIAPNEVAIDKPEAIAAICKLHSYMNVPLTYIAYFALHLPSSVARWSKSRQCENSILPPFRQPSSEAKSIQRSG